MHTRPHGTVTQHTQHTAPGVIARGPSAASLAEGPQHHHALAERVPHAVTVEIAGAEHHPRETAPTQLLSALQTFLAATKPFRYVEDRWVQLLTCARPNEGWHPAARSVPGHASSSDHMMWH